WCRTPAPLAPTSPSCAEGPPPNAERPPPNAEGPPPNAEGPPPNAERNLGYVSIERTGIQRCVRRRGGRSAKGRPVDGGEAGRRRGGRLAEGVGEGEAAEGWWPASRGEAAEGWWRK